MISEPKVKSILIAEQDSTICATLKEYLDHHGYQAHSVCDREEIVARATENGCGVVILDHHLSASNHPQVLELLLKANPTIAVIVLISYPLVDLVVQSYRKGAFDVAVKPVDLFDLSDTIKRAFEQHQINKAYRYIVENRGKFDDLIEPAETEVLEETSKVTING